MQYPRPVNPRPPSNCSECGFLTYCGGLEGDSFHKGCFQRCINKCQYNFCDLACPCLHLNFAEMIEDVGGLCNPPQCALMPCDLTELPLYLPQIDHGSSRDTVLLEKIVAVPLSTVAGINRRGRYVVRYDTADALRDGLRLSRKCEVIITSVTPDQYIEDFWAEHVYRGTLDQLAQLNIRAMTVPNFSFMLDVPRVNSLYNLTRIYRVAERITSAGIATIMHLQATTSKDWSRWVDVMGAQPSSHCVALEFQTGPRTRAIGDKYYAGLIGLQEALGRQLHPFVLAGASRIADLARDFVSFSVVDSMPFMKTMFRQTLLQLPNNYWKWRPERLEKGTKLSILLSRNIIRHRERMIEKARIKQAACVQYQLF